MHPITTMCRVLGVSPGGYYARLKRPPSARAQADGELSARIAAIHRRSHATYGVPRVHAELRAQGRHVGHKRVARLMSTAGCMAPAGADGLPPQCETAPPNPLQI
jgi:transposase InsO family protein